MKRVISSAGIIICFIVSIIVVYFVSFVWIFPYLHDQTLNEFSKSLTTIQLPQNTQEIGRLAKIGQQIGNSDHCDYFAGQMLKTNLPKDQFETYYKNHYLGKSQIEFLWINEQNDYTKDTRFDPTIIHTLKNWVDDKELSDRANVVVYIFEAGMTSALDLRCS